MRGFQVRRQVIIARQWFRRSGADNQEAGGHYKQLPE
jgi:hypothetical protein